MIKDVNTILKRLNSEQRRAVEAIEGPLLVLAGPGTGKTQLLSARIANILERTDTPAHSILAMTFTENGARNMRERLVSFIGQAAYDVHISTYHGFGREIISRFPEYFMDVQAAQPVDELGQLQIVDDIIAGLAYGDPLKSASYYIKDVLSTISELKRALLTPEVIRAIARQNIDTITHVKQQLPELKKAPSKNQALEVYGQILKILEAAIPAQSAGTSLRPFVQLAASELTIALGEAEAHPKITPPLTQWKNNWLVKNSDNNLVLDGMVASQKFESLANILESYQHKLTEHGWYDFDDMIARSIEVLQTHDDLRFSLQEQYLYILLDEFQDTNTAQLRLVELLTNNPVAEGRPNVMAVGDDDQAIFAFQGAQYSNMKTFYNLYRDTAVINLTENYRSHPDIIHTAHNISAQIEQRLHHELEGIDKSLRAASTELPPTATVARHEFMSNVAEAAWTAQTIQDLIANGTDPNEIAILAPKHAILANYIPHLNAHGVPVSYEKREDILQTPLIKQLLANVRLVQALASGNEGLAASLWPEALSAPWWGISPTELWQVSWEVARSRGSLSWTAQLLARDSTQTAVKLILSIVQASYSQPLEIILDMLSGVLPVSVDDQESYVPLKQHIFSTQSIQNQSLVTYEYLSQLTVLREKLRAYQTRESRVLLLEDLIEFIAAYTRADQPINNSSPYHQAAQAVKLMTVYGSKGLEFEHVFVAHAIDEVWGPSAKGNNSKISLPANIVPIRHAGATEDEKLRSLFVAITRAKHGLYLTSHTCRYSGKQSTRLKYLNEQVVDEQTVVAQVLPKGKQVVQTESTLAAPLITDLLADWRAHHVLAVNDTSLRDVLQPRLERYRLSPTHLNTFVDTQYSGPEQFLIYTLLRFPSAPTMDGEFGNAIHQSLEWLQNQLKAIKDLPAESALLSEFERVLQLKVLSDDQRTLLLERGKTALRAFYDQQAATLLAPTHEAEFSFWNEGVVIDGVSMAGNIDLLQIDRAQKTIKVVDYKTGSSYSKWQNELKLFKYKQQLYCYKLLIENSRTFSGYTVDQGSLVFVEPDITGRVSTLDLTFNEDELAATKQLLKVVWKKIINVELPDTASYNPDYRGTQQFIDDLLHEDA